MDVNELKQMVLKFRDDRNWKKVTTHKDSMLALMAEVGELVEHFKWHTEEEMNAYIKKNKNAIGEELSDVLFWVLQISDNIGVDLSEAFPKKMKKNEKKYPVDIWKRK